MESNFVYGISCAKRIRLKIYADNGNKKAKTAIWVIDNFDKVLTAILIGNNVVNLGCSSIATVLCMNIFGDIGAAVATGATTLLVLTFGEVIPKCFGKEAFRRELFLKKHIINDNLWFWVMSILAKRKTRLIKNPSKFFIKFTPILYKNKSNIEITDNEIKYLMRFYKQNIINTINQLSK